MSFSEDGMAEATLVRSTSYPGYGDQRMRTTSRYMIDLVIEVPPLSSRNNAHLISSLPHAPFLTISMLFCGPFCALFAPPLLSLCSPSAPHATP